MRGRIDLFNTDALIDMLARLGVGVRLVAKPSRSRKVAWGNQFDVVVPAPPSVMRKTQPVILIAQGLAAALGVPMREDAVTKAKVTPQMKNVAIAEREKLLQDAIQKGPGEVRGLRILLIDDVTESGATLRRVGEVLMSDGGAQSVHALVITRTK